MSKTVNAFSELKALGNHTASVLAIRDAMNPNDKACHKYTRAANVFVELAVAYSTLSLSEYATKADLEIANMTVTRLLPSAKRYIKKFEL